MNKGSKRPYRTIGIYRCACSPLSGHRYADIMPQARKIFRALQKKTKRRPYVRSAYFRKGKVFFDYFWIHMNQKSVHDRARRLKYLPCALELLKKSHHPAAFINTDAPGIVHHQFRGVSKEGVQFNVIVKQELSSGRKYLLSIFPVEK